MTRTHRSWRRRPISVLVAAAVAAATAGLTGVAGAAPAHGGSGQTHFLDHPALLATGGTSVDDPAWFEQNIPFLEVPDAQIQDVYYYRWQTYKEHLVYTGPEYGYLSSEFLQPVSYGAPYGGVVAAAGHQITEGRWLRDQQYVKDDVNYWLAGPGQFAKSATDAVNADTTDWAHEYSFWAASAVWQQYLATGDRSFAIGQEANLIKQYRGWDNHFNAALGLYWQVPVWDATEFTPASYESSDPYHGGAGYRPTINAYQYGDARAIAAIATLAGDKATAKDYTRRADAVQAATQAHLWDPSRDFFYDLPRDGNPTNALLDTREEEGFVPWMFDLPQASDVSALAELLDPQGFAAPFGPTTAERRSRWFDFEANNCCRWDGPAWPYETSQTLTGVANALDDYPPQSTITAADYVNLLHTYAATQFKNGVPYVAEAHDADSPTWIYDGFNHSEDYNHSTYEDNVISGLLGLRGQAGNSLVVKPLAPASWDYFALENAPYHGHNVTVLWDRTGAKYHQGKGLRLYVDGALVTARPTVQPVTVGVGPTVTHPDDPRVDVAANGQRQATGPQPFASYTSPYDNVWNAVDGIVYRYGIPENSRWTSYASPNASDSYGVNFQRPQRISNVSLTFYDDGGGVRVPNGFDLQYWTGSAWSTVPGQLRSPAATPANAPEVVTFPALTTSQVRVVAPNAGGGTGWGLSELESWAAPVFQIANVNSGKLLAVVGGSRGSGANVQQWQDNGAPDHLWALVPGGGGWSTIVNLNSGLALSLQGASTAPSAQVVQARNTGADDQLWRLIDDSGGRYKILNKNSGLLLGVDQESLADGAAVVQFGDNGTPDHLWTMLSAAAR